MSLYPQYLRSCKYFILLLPFLLLASLRIKLLAPGLYEYCPDISLGPHLESPISNEECRPCIPSLLQPLQGLVRECSLHGSFSCSCSCPRLPRTEVRSTLAGFQHSLARDQARPPRWSWLSLSALASACACAAPLAGLGQGGLFSGSFARPLHASSPVLVCLAVKVPTAAACCSTSPGARPAPTTPAPSPAQGA